MAVDVQRLRNRVKENITKRNTMTMSRTEDDGGKITGSFSKEKARIVLGGGGRRRPAPPQPHKPVDRKGEGDKVSRREKKK